MTRAGAEAPGCEKAGEAVDRPFRAGGILPERVAVEGRGPVFRLRNRFSTVPIFSLHCNTADSPCGAFPARTSGVAGVPLRKEP